MAESCSAWERGHCGGFPSGRDAGTMSPVCQRPPGEPGGLFVRRRIVKAERLTHEPPNVRGRLLQQPVSLYPIYTGGRLSPCAAQVRATRHESDSPSAAPGWEHCCSLYRLVHACPSAEAGSVRLEAPRRQRNPTYAGSIRSTGISGRESLARHDDEQHCANSEQRVKNPAHPWNNVRAGRDGCCLRQRAIPLPPEDGSPLARLSVDSLLERY